MSATAWTFLFSLAAAAMLVAPLMPAWSEWAWPTDHEPLSVAPDSTSRADFFAAHFRDTLQRERTPAMLPPPSEWGLEREAIVVERSLLLHAPARTAATVYVDGDFEAPATSVFGAVLATGDLRLGEECQVQQWAHADGSLVLARGCTALRRVSAGISMRLDSECTFERVHAPRVQFGSDEPRLASPQAAPGDATPFSALPDSRTMAPGFHRVEGNLLLPPDGHYRGNLVVTGSLAIGEGTTIDGAVKARRGVVVGAGARVLGAVCCGGSIHVGRDAYIAGPLVAEADVIIGAGTVIGGPGMPTTVTAQNIMIESGALAHGTVWAREVGVVWGAA